MGFLLKHEDILFIKIYYYTFRRWLMVERSRTRLGLQARPSRPA